MRTYRPFFLSSIPVTALVMFGLAFVSPAIYAHLRADRMQLDAWVSAVPNFRTRYRLIVKTWKAQTAGARRVVVVGDSHAEGVFVALHLGSETPLDLVLVRTRCDPVYLDIGLREVHEYYANHPLVGRANFSAKGCVKFL